MNLNMGVITALELKKEHVSNDDTNSRYLLHEGLLGDFSKLRKSSRIVEIAIPMYEVLELRKQSKEEQQKWARRIIEVIYGVAQD